MTDWPIFAPIAVIAIVGLWKLALSGAQWISREVAENVVTAIGDTLSVRWKADMDKALRPIYAELQDNGGESLKDKVGFIEIRLTDIEQQLEGQIFFRPDRRAYDEDDIPRGEHPPA